MLAGTMRRVPLSHFKPVTLRPIYTGNSHGKQFTFNAPQAPTVLTPPLKLISSTKPNETILFRSFSTSSILSARIIQRFPSHILEVLHEITLRGVLQICEVAFNSSRNLVYRKEHNHTHSFLAGLTHEWPDKSENFLNTELVHQQMEEEKRCLVRMLKLFLLPGTTAVHRKNTRLREEVGTLRLVDFWRETFNGLNTGVVKTVTPEQEMEILKLMYRLKKGCEENLKRIHSLCEKYRDGSEALHQKFFVDVAYEPLGGLPLAEVRSEWLKFYNGFNLECEKQLKDSTLLDDPLNSMHTYLLETFGPQGYTIDIKLPPGQATTKDGFINSDVKLDSLVWREVNHLCDKPIQGLAKSHQMLQDIIFNGFGSVSKK